LSASEAEKATTLVSQLKQAPKANGARYSAKAGVALAA
jgi:hypothetical protein